jgi:DNA-directed RNA polymerase subunit omega
MERIPEKMDSTFRYVLVAARRAEQLILGARPKLETGLVKPTRIAMREVSQEVIDWDYGPMPEPEPPAEAVGEEEGEEEGSV